MNGGGHHPFVLLLAGGLAVAYAVVAHYTSQLPDAAHWAVLLAVLPPAAIGFGMLRSAAPGILGWLVAAAVVALAAAVWPLLQQHLGGVYFAQHAGVNGALGLFFGRTLLAGREPLCTHFASLAHDHVSPRLARYTRQVTVAWTLFFALMVATSVLLFAFASIETWSVFANLLTWPLVGAMFVVEGGVRRLLLPPEERLGLLATIATYRKSMAMRTPRSGKTPSPR
ncbi:MAG: hypothetical protein HYU78_08415 [Rhodocyclales bacterium]|nr:hypothetical protein [Rhodocyclales bacterium]